MNTFSIGLMQSAKSTTQYSQLDLQDNRIKSDDVKKSPSLQWKIFHATHTMFGGIFLIAGSSMYFAQVIRNYSMALTAGGWFFTIGSFFLLLADLQEWWYNRYECCSDEESQDSHSLERTTDVWNCFIAACGSACYVAGSALLIPVFERYATLGNWLIIAGSILIFLCSLWKIYRSGRVNPSDSSDHRFHLENTFNDLSGLIVNIFVGFGGLFYFFGIIYILLGCSMNDFGMNFSSTLCVMGGASFLFASFVLKYRYYYKK